MTRSAYKYTKPNWNWNAYVQRIVLLSLFPWLCCCCRLANSRKRAVAARHPIDWKSWIHFCSVEWHTAHVFVNWAWDWFRSGLFDLVPLIRTIAIICKDFKWSWKQKVILTLLCDANEVDWLTLSAFNRWKQMRWLCIRISLIIKYISIVEA